MYEVMSKISQKLGVSRDMIRSLIRQNEIRPIRVRREIPPHNPIRVVSLYDFETVKGLVIEHLNNKKRGEND